MAAKNETPGEKLSEHADKKGKSTYEVANNTGIPRATIQSIFSGDVDDPGWKKVVSIAEYLGVDLEEIK